MKNKKILITCVGAPPGRGAYESLKLASFKKIYTCDSDKNCYFNIIKKKNFFIVDKANSKNYLSSIKSIIYKNKIEILIPCLEPEVIFWSKNKHKIKNLKILIPKYQSLNKAVNKLNLNKIAKAIGIKYPKTELLKSTNNLNFPMIIKPIVGWGMQNFYLLQGKYDLKFYKKKLNNNKYIKQEYIKSNLKNIFAVGLLYDKNSKCVLSYCSKSLSTLYKLGGPATSGEIISNVKLINESKMIIDKIGNWMGPVMVEWIYNKQNNKYYLIDVNPRLWGYSILGTFNGINFAHNIIRIIYDNKIKTNKSSRKKFFFRDFVNHKI
tara:strand:- start:4130 stop:5095 length:966 start_codon:yes stop_codon:yes gene_type:complete